MASKQEISTFIRSTFRSVWSLELLCLLRRNRDRSWMQEDLVFAMRSSDLVVRQSVDSLLAAGLVVVSEAHTVRYQPANEELDRMAEAAETLYAQRPDAVRRMIVSSPAPRASIFADAFKLRRDE